MMQQISKWNPEDEVFWSQKGKKIANRNLWVSIAALFLAFAVWQIWSMTAVNLNKIGFNFTQQQLFTLAALPGLSGATLRAIYTFVVPIFGGRNWTIISTATLIVPAVGIGLAVQNPDTSFNTMAILAALCGFGGGNFASSMSNIGFFFPRSRQGTALGLNAGLGNFGVSVAQFLVPLVITVGIFGKLGGIPQVMTDGTKVWLQNAGFVWVIPIVLTTIASIFWMNNLPIKASLAEQMVILKRKHNWLLTYLYIMSFGSFIGYAAAFPLLIGIEFPQRGTALAFLGPLIGALIRPVGGWISDKLGGARVTLWDNILMVLATAGVIYFVGPDTKNFYGFFAMFMLLFFTTGIANGSVFRMIPIVMKDKVESSGVVAFSSAVAAYGAFFIPKIFGWSIDITGSGTTALYIFLGYYLTTIFVTWFWYARNNAETPC